MSIGRQVLREILDEIETEFFRRLGTENNQELGVFLDHEETQNIKLAYQKAVTKAIANYLEKVYVG